jgi:hypothetical protein
MNWSEMLDLIAPYVVPATVTAVGALLAALWSWVRSKTKNAKLDKYIDRANDAILTAVAETMQTFVTTMKNNGTWDADAAAKAFEMSMIRAKEIMGAAALQALPEVIGDVEKWLTAKIEAATLTTKAAIAA